MVDTFQASISRRFFISFSSEYYPKRVTKWSPKSMQNPSKNFTFALGHHFGRCWHVLASIWYPFGALWVTFGDLFLPFDGIIERLDLAYFGIFVQPFFYNFIRPESGHDFTIKAS